MLTIKDDKDIAIALMHRIYQDRAHGRGGHFTIVGTDDLLIVATLFWDESAIDISCYPWAFIAHWAHYAAHALPSNDESIAEDAEYFSLPDAMDDLEEAAWDFWAGADPADFAALNLVHLGPCAVWAETDAQFVARFLRPRNEVVE